MIFLYSYIAMLLLGAAHSTDGRVPALGYLTILCIAVALHFLIGFGAKSTRAAK